MVDKRNKKKFFVFITFCIILFFPIYFFGNIDTFTDNDFHYNMISAASIIGGFLFTGLGILISAIDKERIQRLWNNHYLDNLYRFSVIGIFGNIVTIAAALFIICFNVSESITRIIASVELTAIACGLISFVISMLYLRSIIKKLKPNN